MTFTVRRTEVFIKWLSGLKDRRAAARIATRILRTESGRDIARAKRLAKELKE
jgi:putative component of toxin-antitoxin plasmid stabilization module